MTWTLSLLILTVLCTGFLFHRFSAANALRHTAAIRQMTADIALSESTCGKTAILNYSERLIEKKRNLDALKKNAWGAAILGDICRVTQGNIRLTSFLFEQKPTETGTAHVELRGVVLAGQQEQAKAEQDAWIENIKRLNTVKQVTVTHSAQAALADQPDQPVLYFEMDLTFDDKPKS